MEKSSFYAKFYSIVDNYSQVVNFLKAVRHQYNETHNWNLLYVCRLQDYSWIFSLQLLKFVVSTEGL